MEQHAILLSGSGSTAEQILLATKAGGALNDLIQPRLIISSREDAGGIERALKTGTIQKEDVVVLRRRDYTTEIEFGRALFTEFKKRDITTFSQNGWMVKTPRNFLDIYNRGINQHPAPLCPGQPDFGGESMYGKRCHLSRLLFVRMTNRNFFTAAVAQHVHPDYDAGEIICQSYIPVEKSDTADSLAARLLPFEYEVQIAALRKLAMDRAGSSTTLYGIEASEEKLVHPHEVMAWSISRQAGMLAYPKG